MGRIDDVRGSEDVARLVSMQDADRVRHLHTECFEELVEALSAAQGN